MCETQVKSILSTSYQPYSEVASSSTNIIKGYQKIFYEKALRSLCNSPMTSTTPKGQGT